MNCKSSILATSCILACAACMIGTFGAFGPALGSSPEPSPGCAIALRLPAGDYTEQHWPLSQTSGNHPAVWRKFNVHVPNRHEQQPGPPLAMVINLHGSASTGPSQDNNSRMRELGDSKGFIVATPEAWPWNAWAVSRNGFGDVEFIRELLTTLVNKLCVDRNRVFATGLSSGGIMAASLGRASAEGNLGGHKIAAIALVASMPLPSGWQLSSSAARAERNGEQPFSPYVPSSAGAFEDVCKPRVPGEGGVPREPVPMQVFFGNQDRLVANGACYGSYSREVSSFEPVKRTLIRAYLCKCYGPLAHLGCPSGPGIEGNVDSLVAVARCTVNRWAIENGCVENTSDPVPTGRSGWGIPVANVTYNCAAVPNSRGDTILTIYDTAERLPKHPNNSEYPSGHFWPGGARPEDEGDFKVTNANWEFFERHPR
jgi:poly(3-hydroxybutyrate) depolymerase